VAIVKWQNYWFQINHYIIVYLSVTDEQRKALIEQAIAGGYADTYGGLQAYVADVLEPELKTRSIALLPLFGRSQTSR
jgi:mannosyltransferase OCH1-like enzyme